ncbi:MAG TPA: DUF6485 family protein [archaeon]|jgi:hypothetical protein|nr:DUF6485 family protein [archaeon]
MECKKEINKKSCNCTYDCEKKGLCCECVSYHRKRGELPACYFDTKAEKTYDRSIDAFLKSKGIK